MAAGTDDPHKAMQIVANKLLQPVHREDITTIVEAFSKAGRQKGIEKSWQDNNRAVAIKMLAQDLDPEFIHETTGRPVEDIKFLVSVNSLNRTKVDLLVMIPTLNNNNGLIVYGLPGILAGMTPVLLNKR